MKETLAPSATYFLSHSPEHQEMTATYHAYGLKRKGAMGQRNQSALNPCLTKFRMRPEYKSEKLTPVSWMMKGICTYGHELLTTS